MTSWFGPELSRNEEKAPKGSDFVQVPILEVDLYIWPGFVCRKGKMYSGWRDWQGARDVLSSKLANIALFICLLSLLEFTIVFVPKIIKRGSLCIREHVLQQKCFLSGIAEKGGGPLPEFFTLFPPCNCPLYLDINIMLFDTFGSHAKIIKSIKIIITIITPIIVVIIVTWFCNSR